MSTLTRNSRLREGLGNFVLVFLSVGIVILNSAYQRPMWGDEFFHFAWGGYSDLAETITRIFNSDEVLKYNQTGFHYVLNAVTFHFFSASSLTLRWPSLASGVLLCVSAAWILRLLRFSLFWQLLAVVTIGSSAFLMYFVGESRPYMPLAATVLFMLAFYLGQAFQSHSSPKLFLALVVGVIGALMHPYFAFYVLILAVYSTLVAIFVDGRARKEEVVRVMCPQLLLVVVSVALVVGFRGLLSSLQTNRFEYDPFEFIRANGGFSTRWISLHFEYLNLWPWATGVVVAVFFVALPPLVAMRFSKNSGVTRIGLLLAPPVGLVVLSLATSAGISLVSMLQRYWIFERQWVASIGIVAVSFVWVLAALYRLMVRNNHLIAFVLTSSLSAVLLWSFIVLSHQRVSELRENSTIASYYIREYSGISESEKSQRALVSGIVDAANINMYLGGPVWPVFSCFYGCEEGYENRY